MRLRPIVAADLPLPAGGADQSEYDAFGPLEPITTPPPCRIEDDGRLAIEVEGRIVGTIGWHWVQYGRNAASRAAMLGVLVYDGHRGRGHGTQAQRLATDLLFATTTINRVEASTDLTNLAEQRALEKAGFVREGVNRGAQWRDGRFHDVVMYAVLRDEWRVARS